MRLTNKNIAYGQGVVIPVFVLGKGGSGRKTNLSSDKWERGILHPCGQPTVFPAGTPQAGELLFEIILAGTDAKAKDNEEPVQKAGTLKKN